MDEYFNILDSSSSISAEEVLPVAVEACDESLSDCCKITDNIITTTNGTTCTKCGNTISSLSTEAEWRYYGASDTKSSNPTRCGMPVNKLLPKSSMGSTISMQNNNKNMNQIRKINIWSGSMPYKERSLYLVFTRIQDAGKLHGLSKKIIEDSKNIYKLISEKKISRGANRKGIIASCVYFSCKLNDVPRSTKEVAKMFDLNITVMTKGCKLFQNIIQLNELRDSIINTHIIHTESIVSMDFIERFCSKLGMGPEAIEEIKKIAENADKFNLVGQNTPPSVASGCIYLYCIINSLEISKKDISDICLISEVTINKCYKALNENIDKLLS
jgi:transcription initiation factor TFIIB